MAGKIRNHQARRVFEASMTMRVGVGSCPFSSSKTLTNTGTMKSSMKINTSVANEMTTIG